MGRMILLATMLVITVMPTAAQAANGPVASSEFSAQSRPRARLRVYPGRLLYRECTFRLVQEWRPSGVYVVPPDGGAPRMVSTYGLAETSLDWSPDSRRIASVREQVMLADVVTGASEAVEARVFHGEASVVSWLWSVVCWDCWLSVVPQGRYN